MGKKVSVALCKTISISAFFKQNMCHIMAHVLLIKYKKHVPYIIRSCEYKEVLFRDDDKACILTI